MLTVHRLATFLVAAALLLTASCDRRRDRIVGKWTAPGGTSATVWEFSRNGTVTMGTTSGRYTFGDRGRIKIQTPGATFVYEIEFKDDNMIWREANGSRTELRRVP